MNVVMHINNAEHQVIHGMAMKEGLEKHGLRVEFGWFDVSMPADVNIVWGWRQRKVINTSKNILVMERGHVGDRMKYTSCGWNGLGNRGRYPAPNDDGKRWNDLFSGLMKDYRVGGKYVLLIGQVNGDASLYGLKQGFNQWAQSITNDLNLMGHVVRYRSHPFTIRYGNNWHPINSILSDGSLEKDLLGAKFCVVYNSTTCVEAVLYGVPTITLDEGAMAWDVTAHEFYNESGFFKPDRTRWAHGLAWTQWTLDEIRSGVSWDHIKEVM